MSSTAPGEEKVKQIRDFLNLECSLFAITRKCFKTCLQRGFVHERRRYAPKELFQLPRGDPIRHEFEREFLGCVAICTEDFVRQQRAIRERINEETDRVQSENQELFESYYSERSREAGLREK